MLVWRCLQKEDIQPADRLIQNEVEPDKYHNHGHHCNAV